MHAHICIQIISLNMDILSMLNIRNLNSINATNLKIFHKMD